MKRKMPNKDRLRDRYDDYLEYAKADFETYGYLSERCAHNVGVVHGVGFALGYDFDKIQGDIDTFLGMEVAP